MDIQSGRRPLYRADSSRSGLTAEGVITLQHALKRAIELRFQVEPNEIGVVTVGDPEAPNMLLYEAAEGSLGILSRFTFEPQVFHKVVEAGDCSLPLRRSGLQGAGLLRRPAQLLQPA